MSENKNVVIFKTWIQWVTKTYNVIIIYYIMGLGTNLNLNTDFNIAYSECC